MSSVCGIKRLLISDEVTFDHLVKKVSSTGHWWFMFVILGTQAAEIRGIPVQSQPRQIVHKILS
jgi:hypothetical protein